MAGKSGAEAAVDETTEPAPRKTTARTPAAKKSAAKKTSTPRRSAKSAVTDLPVLEKEDPWTPEELAEVRTEL